MATEGAVHTDKDRVWHMITISSFVDPGGGLMMATPYQIVDVADPASEAAATGWWTALTESGGEGAVVKPLSFVAIAHVAYCNRRSSAAVANICGSSPAARTLFPKRTVQRNGRHPTGHADPIFCVPARSCGGNLA